MALAEKTRVTKTALLTLILCSSAFFLGCTGDIVELTAHDASASGQDQGPIGDNDGGVNPVVDMAGMAAPTFTNSVENVIISHGCNAAGCHGQSSPSTLLLGTDATANYAAMKAEAMKNTPPSANSMLLTHLLPGGGHTGGQVFTGTSDPLYQTWLTWINNGEPL
jgi:hypothetical protein